MHVYGWAPHIFLSNMTSKRESDFENLSKRLMGAIGEIVSKRGYTPRLRWQEYIRATPYGRQALHLNIARFSDHFTAALDVAIRFDDLESLLHEGSPLSRAEQRATYSLGAELGNISGQGRIEWTIDAETDIGATAAEMVDTFRRIGEPYLQRYSDMETALVACTSTKDDAWLVGAIDYARCMNAAGLAYLIGRDKDLPGIVRELDRDLVSKNAFGLDLFRDFASRVIDKTNSIPVSARRTIGRSNTA